MRQRSALQSERKQRPQVQRDENAKECRGFLEKMTGGHGVYPLFYVHIMFSQQIRTNTELRVKGTARAGLIVKPGKSF